MSLQSSGEISFSDIANNQNSASLQDLQLKSLSETFASGSIVDGSGAQTTARFDLEDAPYAISEFYDANFSSDEFSNIVLTTTGGDSDFNVVDGENLVVSFDTTQTGTHTVQLVDSSGNVDASGTGTPNLADVVVVTFSSLALTDDTYTPRLRLGFLTQNATNINYHDAITSVAVTDPDASSTPTVAANTTITAIEHTISSIGNSNAIAHYNWTFAKEAGDSGGLNAGEGSYANSVSLTATSDASPSINYKGPGRFSINLRVDGNPTQARNSATATEVEHEIHYTKAVSIGDPSSLNEGSTINTSVTHQGFSSGVDVDLIQASNNAVLLSNDHTTDSRVTKVTNQNQTFTAPSRTTSTLSVKVKAFDGSDSDTSAAFNIYPLIDDEFANGDISAPSSVIVNTNATLSVSGVTDNLVGFAWRLVSGAGGMTAQSGYSNSGGDTDGTSSDATSLISTSDVTNVVRFDTAQEGKTIGLKLYGRINQTSTERTATIDVELADATTINSISSVNALTAVTVAGTHQGFSGGVTFGLVDTASPTSFLSSKSTNDTNNSKFVVRSYSDNFTAADSNTTLTLQGRVIDRSDGTTSQNRNTSTFSVFPKLTNFKNTINPGTNTVYSSTNNTSATTFNGDSTNYVNSVTYGTPGTPTDNVTAYAYSINTAPTGWSFSSPNSATTNFSGGTGVAATKTVTLSISSTAAAGDSATDQSSASTHTLAILYKPCIIAVTHTGGTIIVNDTEVVVSALSWQGFADSAGFQLSIRNSSGTIVGSNTTVNYNNTEGSTTSQISKTGLSINLGDSSSAGTMKVRVARRDNLSTYREFNFTVVDYTSTTIQGVGAGYGTPEQALIAKLAGGAGWSNTTKFFAPGDSFGDGTILYNDNAGNVFNGGGSYHGIKPGVTTSYFAVGTNGAIGGIFVGDSAVPPRDPTGASHSASQTSIAVSNFNSSNYTFSSSGTTTATFDSKVTTKTVTVTWNDNSSIENGFTIYNTNSSGAVLGTTSANVETKAIGGITGNTTFAVHATGNSNGDESILSLNAATTSYTHTNDGTVFLHATKSDGSTVNLGTATGTSGTQTITWDKDVLSAGSWTLRLKYGGYSGTTIATLSLTVAGVLTFGSITGGPTNLNTFGNQGANATAVTPTAHQLSVTNSTGGSITLRGDFTGGSTPSSGDGELTFGMSFSNSVSSFNNNTLSISSGATQTVYIKFELTQVKSNATASGTAQWKLTNNGSTPQSNAIAASWNFNASAP